MPYTLNRLKNAKIPSFSQLHLPTDKAKIGMPLLESRGDRPLKMTFDDQLKALVSFSLTSSVGRTAKQLFYQRDAVLRSRIHVHSGLIIESFLIVFYYLFDNPRCCSNSREVGQFGID